MCTAVTESNVHCTAYIQGSLVKTIDCEDIDGVKNLLLEMDTMIPCDRFEMVPRVSNVQTKTPHKVYAGKLRSLKCCGIAKSEITVQVPTQVAVKPGNIQTYEGKTGSH